MVNIWKTSHAAKWVAAPRLYTVTFVRPVDRFTDLHADHVAVCRAGARCFVGQSLVCLLSSGYWRNVGITHFRHGQMWSKKVVAFGPVTGHPVNNPPQNTLSTDALLRGYAPNEKCDWFYFFNVRFFESFIYYTSPTQKPHWVKKLWVQGHWGAVFVILVASNEKSVFENVLCFMPLLPAVCCKTEYR